MKQDSENKIKEEQTETAKETRPNENAGFYFSSSLKITDPETGKVLLHKRCD